MHQDPARTVGDPYKAYVPGEVTQVSRITNVHPYFLQSQLGIVAVNLLHHEPARTTRTVGEPFTAYDTGEVTQVSRMTNVHP